MLPLPERIRLEQLKLFAHHMRTSSIGSLITLVAVAFVFWDSVDHVLLVTLVLLMVTVLGLRLLLGHLFDNGKVDLSVWQWSYYFVFLTTIAGLIWGYVGYSFFFIENPWQIIFISVVILSLPAGASITHSAHLPFFYVSVIPMTGGLIIRFLLEDTVIFYALGYTSILYLIGCSIWSRNLHHTFIESIKLRFENIELIEQLSQQKEKAEMARKQAENANMAKSQFLAAASHDLRQPLHALGLFVSQLDTDDRTNKVVPKINDSLNALTSLLNALLDMSKLDAGSIEADQQHFYLMDLFNRLKSEFSLTAHDKQLTFRMVKTSVVAYSDPALLERILRNLISNAINYTQTGKVLVGCRRRGDTIRIEVWDTGLGINKDEWENIFLEFNQLNNPERNRNKGLGLGLAIVQQLCQLLGHTIEIQSTPGKGTVFSLLLQQGDNKSAIQATPLVHINKLKSNMQGLIVLMIDDELTILDAMNDLLVRWGCKTVCADSIEVALELLEKQNIKPDVILSDYRLRNNITGIDAIKAIRLVCKENIPAVLISGDTASVILKTAHAFNCPLLHKPVKPAKLRAVLSNFSH